MVYTYGVRDQFLTAINQTYDALTSQWISQVSQQFGWKVADLTSVYDRTQTDAHNSEMRSRAQWKYALAQGVFGTPTAFVNGVRVQNIPFNAEGWFILIDDVYKSQ